MNLGILPVDTFKLGALQVDKIYLGSLVAWQALVEGGSLVYDATTMVDFDTHDGTKTESGAVISLGTGTQTATVGTPIDSGGAIYKGLQSSTSGGEPFSADYEFTNISVNSTTDVLNTPTEIVDGDKLVIVLDDDSVNEIVASGVTDNGETPITQAPFTEMGVAGTSVDMSNNNLTATANGSGSDSQQCNFYTSAPITSGFVYWEATVGTLTSTFSIGVCTNNTYQSQRPESTADGYGYEGSGVIQNNGSTIATGASFDDGDVLGTAYEHSTGEVSFYKNGVFQATVTVAPNTDVYPYGFVRISGNSQTVAFQSLQYMPASLVYSIPYVGMTATSKAYAVGALPSFNFGGNGFIQAIDDGSGSYVYADPKLTSTRTFNQLIAPVGGMTLQTQTMFKSEGDKMTDLRATILSEGS